MNELNPRGPRNCLAGGRVGIGATLLGCWLWSVCAMAVGQVSAKPAPALHVMVLRSNGNGVSASGDAIDTALVRELSALAGVDNAQLSPVEYEEVQLTVGCDDQSRDCLAAIADTARLSSLVVRSLRKVAAGLQLDVVYFDVSSRDAPARVSETGDEAQLVATIPSVVRRLFGIPDVRVAVATEAALADTTTTTSDSALSDASATAATVEGGINTLTVASIVTLAVGAGVGLIGVAVGASASAAFDEYKATDVTDAASARRARAAFDDADSRATLANVLLPIGGAMLATGVVMLVVGLNEGETKPASAPHVSFVPSLTGGAVMVSGAL